MDHYLNKQQNNNNISDTDDETTTSKPNFMTLLRDSYKNRSDQNKTKNTTTTLDDDDDFTDFDKKPDIPQQPLNSKYTVKHYSQNDNNDNGNSSTSNSNNSSQQKSNKRKEMDEYNDDQRPLKKTNSNINQQAILIEDDPSFGDIDFDDQAQPPQDIDNLVSTSDDIGGSSKVSDELQWKWQWRTDNQSWVSYDIEMMYQIEDSYQQNRATFDVDRERYIQFSSMTQRRFDSKTKQRSVQRIPMNSNTNNSSKPTAPTKPSTTNQSPFTVKPSTTSTSTTPKPSHYSTPPQPQAPKSFSTSTPTKKIQWIWKDTNEWKEYNSDISEQLEASYQNGNKPGKITVDDDRYIDMKDYYQKRFDNPTKVRPIKRVDNTSNNNNNNNSSNSSNSNKNVSPVLKSASPQQQQQQQQQPKQQSPVSSTSTSTSTSAIKKSNNDNSSSTGYVRWEWLSDRDWEPYPKEISDIIEEANSSGQKSIQIEVSKGEFRLIDLQASCQRRIDDHSKRRSIKRCIIAFEDPNKSKDTKPKPSSSSDSNNNNNNSSKSTFGQSKPNSKFKEDDLFPDEMVVDNSDLQDEEYSQLNSKDPKYLEKKRELYQCGKQYLVLQNVKIWNDVLEANRSKITLTPKKKPSEELNKKISLFGGNITWLEIDAIVNAARTSLLGGGGIDGSIHMAAGPLLLKECRTLKGCNYGDAKISKGYRLPAKHVIHTVGPIDQNPKTLAKCYDNCLKLILQHQIRSVAFCCIATGVYGFPNVEAAEIAVTKVRDWMEINHKSIDRIIFCIFTQEDYKIYGKKLQEYFPIVPQ
ncbi:hypothetical protein DLAC_05799 [Tieghemostelium lacteum]|uniref:Uncharacterized protein n=1 Tax=Tieghemostelium lacteum TaxID=361077 RepID=A0A151ZGV8_TIELA|nr:hypothetical protein DLAC_05799 [Tieghemostelium lacteum]|eukprot:KYQ93165.1 hypothetical protein DLAC_05799 [Tieghemostelium lacteum]